VPREWVLPLFVVTVAFFGLLISFPFEVLALGTFLYLAAIPFGIARYRQIERTDTSQTRTLAEPAAPPPTSAV